MAMRAQEPGRGGVGGRRVTKIAHNAPTRISGGSERDFWMSEPPPTPPRPGVRARRNQSGRDARLDRLEELRVGVVLGQRLEQTLHRLHRLECEERAAQLLHLLVLVLREELLLLAGAGSLDVDGREDALLRELPVEVDLRVAGALELLEDDLVHPRAGV